MSRGEVQAIAMGATLGFLCGSYDLTSAFDDGMARINRHGLGSCQQHEDVFPDHFLMCQTGAEHARRIIS